MSGADREKDFNSNTSQRDCVGETENLVSGTGATVISLLNDRYEGSDNQKMIARLGKLDRSLGIAQEMYELFYGQSYGNIHGAMASLEYGAAEGFDSGAVELQTLFCGLREMDLSAENIALFQNLESRFMARNPDTQARMLWYFELIHDYVVSKGNDLSIHTNPLKSVLFSEKDIPYIQWMTGIFDGFETNESQMRILIEAIRKAEAPQIGLKQFIRHLFNTKREVIEESDREWLGKLYAQWPNEQASNQPDTISNSDKKERDRIAKKYLLGHSEHGVTTSPLMVLTKKFRDSLVHA